MRITMKNPKTGELKDVKVGWSWTLFFFSSFFGLPLFLRKLNIWGGVAFALCSLSLFSMLSGRTIEALFFDLMIMIANLGLSIFLAIKGNEFTAKNYIENGWMFVESDSDLVKMAKVKWGITT